LRDDAVIRLLAADALADAGVEVIEAENADDVVAMLQSRGATIDVLFTEVQLSGTMDGWQLVQHVHQHWPGIGILVASGRGTLAATLPPASRFLAKPYTLDRLVAHVQELAAA
jgi:DNA-binding NtrC family response regulator